jgi:hypothetical protein
VVNPDRSFTETYGTCTGTILTGSLEGQPFTAEGIVVQGQIAVGLEGRSLVYNDNATNLVTITVNPGSQEFVRQRICGEIGTGVMRSVYEHEYDQDREYDYHRDRDYDYDDDDDDKHRHKHRGDD